MDFNAGPPANFGEYQLTYRSGDVVIPRIDALEPLSLELPTSRRRSAPAPSRAPTPRSGLEIVEVIEAAEMSLRRGGARSRSLGGPGAGRRMSTAPRDGPLRVGMVATRTTTSTRGCSARRERWPSGATRWTSSASASPRRDAVGAGVIRVHEVRMGKARGGAARTWEATARFLRAPRRAADRRSARGAVRRRRSAQHAGLPPAAALVPKLRGAPVILNVHDTFPELFATKFGAPAGRRGGAAGPVQERVERALRRRRHHRHRRGAPSGWRRGVSARAQHGRHELARRAASSARSASRCAARRRPGPGALPRRAGPALRRRGADPGGRRARRIPAAV